MFTGIIERVGVVAHAEFTESGARIRLETGFSGLQLGESVAVNGVCLTVTEATPEGEAAFFMSLETLRLTALSELRTGRRVNLERALPAGGRLSGHVVQGHVDGMGSLESLVMEGESRRMTFRLPAGVARYTVTKGSLAIDGVSLTVNSVSPRADGTADASFQIIPHTWAHTAFGELTPGSPVNLEADVLAKYVEKLCQPYSVPSNS